MPSITNVIRVNLFLHDFKESVFQDFFGFFSGINQRPLINRLKFGFTINFDFEEIFATLKGQCYENFI